MRPQQIRVRKMRPARKDREREDADPQTYHDPAVRAARAAQARAARRVARQHN